MLAYSRGVTTARKYDLVTVDEYLEAELSSVVKHEYLGGVVYAMSGGSNRHNRIALNSTVSLANRLRGKPCQPFNSDTKVRVRLPSHDRFYYPDASVVCHENPPQDSYQDEPVVLVEVLSPSTRRTDEGEKRDAYLTIPSLAAYLLVEQDSPAVVILRRTGQGFQREVHEGLDAVVALPELGVTLPLAEVYDGVSFEPGVPS